MEVVLLAISDGHSQVASPRGRIPRFRSAKHAQEAPLGNWLDIYMYLAFVFWNLICIAFIELLTNRKWT